VRRVRQGMGDGRKANSGSHVAEEALFVFTRVIVFPRAYGMSLAGGVGQVRRGIRLIRRRQALARGGREEEEKRWFVCPAVTSEMAPSLLACTAVRRRYKSLGRRRRRHVPRAPFVVMCGSRWYR